MTRSTDMGSRRRFLTGVASAGTVAIAGCSSVPLLGDDGPEDAVEKLLTAIQNLDVDAANEVLHPESPSYPIEEGDFENESDFTFTNIHQVSTNEFVEWQIKQSGGSVDEATEEEIQERIEGVERMAEGQVDEISADDFAWVLVTIEENGEQQEQPVQTVQDDGDWYVLF